ncbi:MAG: NAD-dependent epimerase/dehydratase family protein [Candidatus Omnitrophica bacterium]|nr:NAD-dependent epimerase/dehydratase family protein [Candidatus Omnitrophota bacterium]
MKRVLVTGGAGFIGSHLVDYLLKRGDTVTCLDNLTTGSRVNIEHHAKNKQFKVVEGSILNESLVEQAVLEADLIFHLAAAVGVRHIVQNPLESIIVNVEGTACVLRYAHKYKKKIVLASSSEVYGKSNAVPYREDGDRLLGSTTINRWSYAASKAIDEHMALNYASQGLPVVILRFFNTYGPRINEQAYGTVIAQFIRQAFLNDPMTVHGSGYQVRCFTYVEDTVAGVVSSSEIKEAEGQIFNLGNPRPWTVVDLAQLVKKITRSKSEISHVPYKDYYGLSYEDTPIRIPDITKAHQILDFNPEIHLEEGLRRTINWCRENYQSARNTQKKNRILSD